jgi:preprotein translocase SecE subunit
MAKYKPDQGTYARTTSLLLLSGLVVFGCHTLYYWLLSFRGDDASPGFMVRDLSGGPVPVVGLPLTPALLIAVVVGIGLVVLAANLLNKPKAADMLIECETEMRKCTWPSGRETVTASMVILVVMLFFTAAMAAFDFVLNGLMSQVVFG